MREIKFRGWWKDTLEPIPDFMEQYTMDILNGLPDNSFIYSQFTGLLDKNGKEIYEGDIVREQLKIPKIHQVLWFDEGAGFVFQNIKDTDDCWCPNEYATANLFEIIGNIYENPGLLDKKQGPPCL